MKSSNTLTKLFFWHHITTLIFVKIHWSSQQKIYGTTLLYYALKLNADETDLLYLAKKINQKPYKFENKKLTRKLKYLGVTIDNELNYQTEVKHMLTKKAQSIKCLYNLRDCLPKNLLNAMINNLVFSHLQLPAPLLCWAVKACYHRSKFASFTGIEQPKILPVYLLLDYRITCYLFLLITNRKPAFNSPNENSVPTFDCYKHQRTGKFFPRLVSRRKYHDKNVIRRGIVVFEQVT